ncbi:MAG: exodeoxyribonuclease III, partial [Alphaproteobacteria bacterium]
MKIASWNVNSIRARLPRVLDWLRDFAPDVALLQEIKCMEETFPALEIGDLGYNIAVFGQKSYNGVAILSKRPIDDVMRGLPGLEDEQARYIEASIG